MIWATLASILDLSGTVITLQPSAEPGAVAEVDAHLKTRKAAA